MAENAGTILVTVEPDFGDFREALAKFAADFKRESEGFVQLAEAYARATEEFARRIREAQTVVDRGATE